MRTNFLRLVSTFFFSLLFTLSSLNSATAWVAVLPTPVLNTAIAGNTNAVLGWSALTGATSYSVKYGTVPGVYVSSIGVGNVTSYTLGGLTNGTTYYVVVIAKFGLGTSNDSNQKIVVPVLPVPVTPSLSSVTAGDAKAVLSWGAVAGATSYSVKYGTAAGVYGTPVNVGNVTTHTVNGLTNGITYYFVITAGNTSGTSANSAVQTALPVPFPVAPAFNTLTAGNANAVLGWSAVTGATSYSVKYGTTSGNYGSSIGVGNITSYTLSGLTNGTTYYVVVTATNALGTSVNSVEKSATPVLPVPAVPSFSSATAGDAKAVLTWSMVAGATSYSVKFGTVTGVYGAPVNVGNVTTHTVTGLTNGTTYYFVITASNASGTSANSAVKTALPVAFPVAPVFNTLSSGNANAVLGWSAVTGATNYSVKYGTLPGIYGSPIGVGNVTTYTLGGLTNGTTYYVVITAANALGTSVNSVEKSVIPVLPVPAVPSFSSATAGDAKAVLTWSAVAGATSYSVKFGTVTGVYGAPVNVGNVTTYTVNGLTNSTTYYFVITAANSSGTSANSAVKTALPVAFPVAPVFNTLTAGNTNAVLGWSAATGATSYSLKYGTISGIYGSPIGMGSGTSYTLGGLTNGTTYYVVITATNALGTSVNSIEKSVKPVLPVPAIPSFSSATAGDAKAVLSWGAVAGATSYSVKYGTATGVYGAPVNVGNVTTLRLMA